MIRANETSTCRFLGIYENSVAKQIKTTGLVKSNIQSNLPDYSVRSTDFI